MLPSSGLFHVLTAGGLVTLTPAHKMPMALLTNCDNQNQPPLPNNSKSTLEKAVLPPMRNEDIIIY